MQITIIYTKQEMLLTKKAYVGWREVQAEYLGYKSSLGPWEIEEVVDYLEFDYANLEPSASVQVNALINGPSDTIALTFKHFVK